MRLEYACAFFVSLLAVSGMEAACAEPVGDANTAIALAQKKCPPKLVAAKSGWDALLAQISSPKQVAENGHWNAVRVQDSWHVWFGESQKETGCDFKGAYISRDGTRVDCVLTEC
jgi:hypothetical protein